MAEVSTQRLKCPLCLERFKSPKVLDCFHTFCENCLSTTMFAKKTCRGKDIFECPVCATHIRAPAQEETQEIWAYNLPTNFPILSFIEGKGSESVETVFCQPCQADGKMKASVAFCVDCSEYLCCACRKSHALFKMSKNHLITEESVRTNQIPESDSVYLDLCNLHNKPLAYYCNDHKGACCVQCIPEVHRKCTKIDDIVDLAQYEPGDDRLKEEVRGKLEILMLDFQQIQGKREENLKLINEQKEEIRKCIETWRKNLVRKVKELETSALERLDEVHQDVTTELSNRLKECKSAIAAVEVSNLMLDEAIKMKNERQTFIALTKISKQAENYLTNLQHLYDRAFEISLEYATKTEVESFYNADSLGDTKKHSKSMYFSFGSINETEMLMSMESFREYEKKISESDSDEEENSRKVKSVALKSSKMRSKMLPVPRKWKAPI
ncbi:hypothetical protein ACJMK2_016346 [Sinanodonta woodiana]|uniref:Uncharacterized protein n=1 Tax=Sinanodonta woodiana TaxID=1069815 RepID=A0ABD3UW36_SINWO